jgi:hypothetical protein
LRVATPSSSPSSRQKSNSNIRDEESDTISNDGSDAATGKEDHDMSKEPSHKASEKKKWILELEPHTAERIVDGQRQDPDLRHFMTTRSGLYDTKYMRIQAVHGFQIVCFKKRVYMPALLRSSTISYYVKTYRQGALERLKKNFIWPTLEEDFHSLLHDCEDGVITQPCTEKETCIAKTGVHRRRATFS